MYQYKEKVNFDIEICGISSERFAVFCQRHLRHFLSKCLKMGSSRKAGGLQIEVIEKENILALKSD